MWPEEGKVKYGRLLLVVMGLRRSSEKMRVLVVLALCLRLVSLCCGQYHLHINFLQNRHPRELLHKRMLILDHEIRMSTPGLSAVKPPENLSMSSFAPRSSSISSYDNGSTGRPAWEHHRKIPQAPFSIFPQVPDCDGVICFEPLIATPIDSPCGCVLPLKVIVDIEVSLYQLFTHITELEVEVAAGISLKQSQIKIISAVASIQDPWKTRVTLYLIPLHEKFDSMTALFIYERFWLKRVPIQMPIFGDYKVIDIHYPGLPFSLPSTSDPSASGSHQFPFAADVPSSKAQKLNSGIIIVIAFSSFNLILACVGIIIFILKWRELSEQQVSPGPAVTPSTAKRSGFRSIMSFSMASSTSASFISTMAICPPTVKIFSLSELEKATDQFSSKKILGKGGFSCVYHGQLEDGCEVAVKLLTKRNQDGEREFIAEVEIFSRLHHRNLVKLIGVCTEGNKRCLVCELVRNGSVESHLHGADRNKGPLDWDARIRIALGAARGLAYLHEDSNPHVIHRDFKASNVLLEEDFTPKVADFGLAREASEVDHHISTRVMGTFGYVAPEYAMTGHVLVKSDVYSYGVVLLELLSGRQPVYMSQSGGPENIVTWARPLLSDRVGVEQLIDPFLSGNCNMDHVAKVAAIASLCVHTEPSERPFMGEVVQALELIYNDMDGGYNDSHSKKESSSCIDYDYKGDFDAENSWRHRDSPDSAFERNSSFMTMECSSDPMDEVQRSQSTSKMEAINKHNSSGP